MLRRIEAARAAPPVQYLQAVRELTAIHSEAVQRAALDLFVTPQDIVDYGLREQDAVHPLKEVDIKRARDALKNDPFFQTHKEWKKAMELLLSMGIRAEQQAFAAYDLNFVIREYLPRKLKDTRSFLP